jgi:hypothetical protein
MADFENTRETRSLENEGLSHIFRSSTEENAVLQPPATEQDTKENTDDLVGDKTLPKDHPYYNIPINFNIITPEYNNNEEYRKALQELCFLRYPDTFPSGDYPEGTDPECCHEMTYDLENMTYALDFVWHNTRRESLFMDLYKLAAVEMMTEDLEVGLAILFSYDYLMYFYPVFREYMVLNEQFNERHPLYMLLKQKLSKK